MKFAFIDAKKALFPVATLCRHLGISRSGYCAWVKRHEQSERTKSDPALCVEVRAVHQESRGTHGAPHIHAELKARDRRVARKHMARLMLQAGLRARARRRSVRTTDSAHRPPWLRLQRRATSSQASPSEPGSATSLSHRVNLPGAGPTPS